MAKGLPLTIKRGRDEQHAKATLLAALAPDREPHLALRFSPIDKPLRDLEIWHANSDEYLFAMSRESGSVSEIHGWPGFVA